MLELLQQLPHSNGQVICVVRAPDDASARQRVLEPLRRTPAVWQRLQALDAERRLTVFAGDIARAQLGLGNAAYTRVCNEVDTVLHNAALVNHALPFAALVEPNVLGCAELMQVALRGQRKTFNYLSTVGHTGARDQPVRESASAADLWPERSVKQGYAAGYVSSKWACEVLLEDLHVRTQLPVNIFRPSMILPSIASLGQINLPDIFSRFLMTVVHTGMAPHSWYIPGSAEFYDGTPVDWVARGIVRVACGIRQGCQRLSRGAPGKCHIRGPRCLYRLDPRGRLSSRRRACIQRLVHPLYGCFADHGAVHPPCLALSSAARVGGAFARRQSFRQPCLRCSPHAARRARTAAGLGRGLSAPLLAAPRRPRLHPPGALSTCRGIGAVSLQGVPKVGKDNRWALRLLWPCGHNLEAGGAPRRMRLM